MACAVVIKYDCRECNTETGYKSTQAFVSVCCATMPISAKLSIFKGFHTFTVLVQLQCKCVGTFTNKTEMTSGH